MTAFGFIMFLLGTIGLGLADDLNLRDNTRSVLCVMFFAGCASLVTGFAVWLWRVMP